MKSFIRHFLLPLAAVLLAGACDKNGTEPTGGAPESIVLSSVSLTASADGETLSFTVTSPFRCNVSGVPVWMKLESGSFSDYKTSFTLTVEPNPSFEERSAELMIYSGSLFAALPVSQKGAEYTGGEASEGVRKVMAFLREQSGKKILSGVQAGGTANNNQRLEQIHNLTGKHPAVAGYDYIFLQYSPTPESWDWKVNYADISAQKEQWQNNGLVTYMWHWNVPTSKEAWEKGKQGDFDGYNFYSDETAFDINRALTEGTWENEFILKDIEKVAGYLKLLKDAGIPVLWRPLHEAAGNYDVYGKNGAWFWWGRGGAEPCKKLWKLLRDKLEGEYGLDNLIWVWTLDATPGAEDRYAEWYPGNSLVDIVGVDIYADDTEAKERQYKAAVALTGGEKLVTVSECGNIPDPEKSLDAGHAWSWFLTWDLESYKLNTNDYWKKLMGSDRVLARESMPSLK